MNLILDREAKSVLKGKALKDSLNKTNRREFELLKQVSPEVDQKDLVKKANKDPHDAKLGFQEYRGSVLGYQDLSKKYREPITDLNTGKTGMKVEDLAYALAGDSYGLKKSRFMDNGQYYGSLGILPKYNPLGYVGRGAGYLAYKLSPQIKVNKDNILGEIQDVRNNEYIKAVTARGRLKGNKKLNNSAAKFDVSNSVRYQSYYPVKVKKYSSIISELMPLIEDHGENYESLSKSDQLFLESLDDKLDTLNWNQAQQLYQKNNPRVLSIVSKVNYDLADNILCSWVSLGSISYYYTNKHNFPIFSSTNYLKHSGNVSPSDIDKMKKIDSELIKCKSKDERDRVLAYYSTEIDDIRDYIRGDYLDDVIKSELE